MSLAALGALGCTRAPRLTPVPTGYACIPFRDARQAGAPQSIPGRVENELFDMNAGGTGEGACYHDTDTENHGSGTLNGTGSYLDAFRMAEGVDVSYTKFNHA